MVLIKMVPTDLKLGKRGKNDCCPVTYAIMRVFYDSKVLVFGSFALIDNHMVWLPEVVEKFVYNWDHRRPTDVITFQLPDPPKELKFKDAS